MSGRVYCWGRKGGFVLAERSSLFVARDSQSTHLRRYLVAKSYFDRFSSTAIFSTIPKVVTASSAKGMAT